MVSLSCAVLTSLLLQAVAGTSDTNPQKDRQFQNQPARELQNYQIRAFLCDGEYELDPVERPLEDGRGFRVCLETTEGTAQKDLSILKINSFKFFKPNGNEDGKTLTQSAIDAGAAELDSVLDCPGGDSYCSFRTLLRSNFYDNDGTVEGVGSVALQFGTGSGRRLLSVPLRGLMEQHDQRRVQDFARLVPVSITFKVEDGFDKNKVDEAKYNFKEHWNEQPAGVQGLYVGGILILLILICCFCAGLILWRQCCADLPGTWIRREPEGVHVHVMPPMDAKATDDGEDDASGTYSLDDDLDVQDDDDESSSDEESAAVPTIASSVKRLENGDGAGRVSPSYATSNGNITDVAVVSHDDQSKENSKK